MIYDNTIYSQSKDSIYLNNTYSFNILARIFTLNLKVAKYKGVFESKIIEDEKSEVDSITLESLPTLNKGEKIAIKGYEIKEVEKAKPKRYKEADFIPLLQKEGIGRPSTYATIILLVYRNTFKARIYQNRF